MLIMNSDEELATEVAWVVVYLSALSHVATSMLVKSDLLQILVERLGMSNSLQLLIPVRWRPHLFSFLFSICVRVRFSYWNVADKVGRIHRSCLGLGQCAFLIDKFHSWIDFDTIVQVLSMSYMLSEYMCLNCCTLDYFVFNSTSSDISCYFYLTCAWFCDSLVLP